MSGKDKEEREFDDSVLARAGRPRIPADARERLLARLPARAPLLARPATVRRSLLLPAGAALAACFAAGIYLGIAGTTDGLWPPGREDTADLIGLGEAEDYFDGDTT